jgi:hypothetical protein
MTRTPPWPALAGQGWLEKSKNKLLMKRIVLWIAWSALFVIYTATIFSHCAEGEYYYLGFAILSFACCALLFFVEGFEIAFAMMYPQRNQMNSEVCRSLQALDAEHILAQRQVVVVATITILSLTSVFDWIRIPGAGRVSSPVAMAWFSGLFVTLTVLWFCQVLPKRLAARNAEQFWRLSRWLLKPIVIAGKYADVPAPAENLVRLWENFFPPSRNESVHQHAVIRVARMWSPCDCPVCAGSYESESYSASSLDDEFVGQIS